jgi:hypothetical protein
VAVLNDEICECLRNFASFVDSFSVHVNKQTHQSMALDVLRNSAFKCETIGRIVQPQSDGVSALFAHCAGIDD